MHSASRACPYVTLWQLMHKAPFLQRYYIVCFIVFFTTAIVVSNGSKMSLPDQEEPVVFLSNMPYGTAASTIQYGLERDGIEHVSVEVIARGVKDRKQSSGLAIVKFASEAKALEFVKEWEGKEFDGRPVWVSRHGFLERPEMNFSDDETDM